jgi:uncharacterized protein DUF5946
MAPVMSSEQDLYYQLSYYTLAQRDPSFIHQNVVDAYAAQHADETTRPITVVFALVGLYLHVERNFTGRQVQQAHMRLAKRRKQWFCPELPEHRGALVISDVMAAKPGNERDAMIRKWCTSVWEAWRGARDQIVDLAKWELDIG